jgi:hypothetical protein
MLESYILLEPNVSGEHIVKTKIIGYLAAQVHNPLIYELVLGLIEPNLSRFDIFGETQVIFYLGKIRKKFSLKRIGLKNLINKY